MNRFATGFLLLACASLAAALAVQRSTISELRSDAEQARARLDRIESRQKEALTKAAIEEVQEQAARAERKASAAQAAALAAAPKAAGDETKLPLAVTEEDLQKIVDEKVEAKLQARGEKKNGGLGEDRKMPLHDLSKELALDPAVQARVAGISNTAKKEIFEIIKTPRNDGTNMADDLIAAFTSGDAAAAQKAFGKLLSDKIPGTDTPYITAVARVQEKANQGLAVAMGTETFGRFQHMGIHPENIETGFDPWSEYLQQKSK